MVDSLTYGGVSLIGGEVSLGRGYDYGSPQTVTEAVSRLLVDGEVVTGRRSSNRQVTLPLVITASRARAMVLLEQLAALVQEPQQLVWTPEGGVATVFDCYRGSIAQQWDSLAERQSICRATITVPAAPFSRPLGRTILPNPTAAADVVLDPFEATTGFTSTGATLTAVTSPKAAGTNSLRQTVTYTIPAEAPGVANTTSFSLSLSKTLAAAANLTARRLLRLWFAQTTNNNGPRLRLTDSAGSWREYVGSSSSSAADFSPPPAFYVYDTRGAAVASSGATFNWASVSSFTIFVSATQTGNYGTTYTHHFWYDDLRAQATNSGAITGPSNVVTYMVDGSARVPATLQIVATTACTSLLLASSPTARPGFTPLVQTTTGTADSTAFHGFHAGASLTYTAPAASLSGTYVVAARARCSAGATGSKGLQAVASQTGGPTQTVTRYYSDTEAPNTFWRLLPIGEVTLPVLPVAPENTTATVSVTVSAGANSNGALGTWQVDEVYLLDLAGSVVLATLPTSYRYFWLDAPDPAGFGATLYGGTTADRTNAVSLAPYVQGSGAFNLDPGQNSILLVMDQSETGGTMELLYHPRYVGAVPS